MDQLIKTLSERKRRTFLRYMEKGKKKERKRKIEENEEDPEDSEIPQDPVEEEVERVAHTREELLHKIEKLKLSAKEDEENDLYEGLDETDSDMTMMDLLKKFESFDEGFEMNQKLSSFRKQCKGIE